MIYRMAAALLLSVTLAGCQEFMSGGNDNLFSGGDKDCEDIRKKVWVGDNDPHDLDADGDGWGCEAYG